MKTTTEQLISQLIIDVGRLGDEIQGLKRQLAHHQAPVTTEQWLPTGPASIALRNQGISRAEELRELVRIGVLPIDGKHVRDVAQSPGKARYEFAIAPCARQIAWWKGVSAEERQRRLSGEVV